LRETGALSRTRAALVVIDDARQGAAMGGTASYTPIAAAGIALADHASNAL